MTVSSRPSRWPKPADALSLLAPRGQAPARAHFLCSVRPFYVRASHRRYPLPYSALCESSLATGGFRQRWSLAPALFAQATSGPGNHVIQAVDHLTARAKKPGRFQ